MTTSQQRARSASRPLFFEFEQELNAFDRSYSRIVARLTRTQNPIPEENEQRYTHGRSWIHPTDNDTGEMHTFSAQTELSFEDILAGQLIRIPETIAQVSKELNDHFMKMFYGTIAEGASKVGNVTSADAAGSFAEGFLEAMRKIEFGVDRDGNVSLPEIHVGTGGAERMIAELEAQPPEYHAEIERLKAEKTSQALEREVQRRRRFKGLSAE